MQRSYISYQLKIKKRGYFLKEGHSEECNDLSNGNKSSNKIKKDKKILGKNIFVEECQKITNKSSIYDRTLFKNKFRDNN